MSDLLPLPCPFCGGDAFLERWMPDNDGRVYCQSCVASQPVTTQQSDASAIAAWNCRAPSVEETRLRAEVASLRAALGQQPAAEGAEPVGCPIPGMCAAVAAYAAAYRAGAEAMRDAAAEAAGFAAWKHEGDDAYSRGMDAGATHQVRACVDAIRALPLPAAPPGEG